MKLRGLMTSLGAGGSLIAAALCALALFGGLLAFRGGSGDAAEARGGDIVLPDGDVAGAGQDAAAAVVATAPSAFVASEPAAPGRPAERRRTADRSTPSSSPVATPPAATPAPPPAAGEAPPAATPAPAAPAPTPGAVRRAVEQVRETAAPVVEAAPQPVQDPVEQVVGAVEQVAGTVDETLEPVAGLVP